MKEKRKVTAVILAAGKGVRMKLAGSKVILPLGGYPFIYYLIDNLKGERFIKEINIVLGYRKEEVKSTLSSYFPNLKFSWQKELNGSAKALQAARKNISAAVEEVLVACGDTFIKDKSLFRRFYNYFKRRNLDGAVLSLQKENPHGLGRIVRGADNGLLKIIEEKDASLKEKQIKEVNSGIYLFKKSLLFSALAKIKKNTRKGEYYLTDIISILKAQGKKIGVFSVAEDTIITVNTQKELLRAEYALKDRIIENLMAKGVRIIDPRNTYIYHKVSVGKGTVIYPFTFIENDVKIGRHCRIGPFAHIRAFTRIEDKCEIGNFAELVRSRLQSGVKMKHFSYSGDAQIGKNTNIGAGSVIANYDGRNKHKTYIGEKAFIGSNSTLVAPAFVGAQAVVGAGSVVTKKVPAAAVVVGVPAKKLRRKK